MFSVLIQNQKTIELFQEFHPLFLEAINRKEIGVCRWMEPGTTVDTALPELRKMIEDKEEWRAIIVRVIDEEDMSQYEYDNKNPFDFKYYHDANLKYQESPIPLVRLTNMLGEMPAPDIKYDAVTVLEENRSPKIVYRPRKSDEDEETYQQLLDKYDYDGKAPSEVILISVRKAQKEKKDSVEKAWMNYKEIESSSFWKQNRYSTFCRFIVYDIKRQGNIQYDADMFKFWSAVLMLAKNEIDTDELQAYRLYKVDINIDREILESKIQKAVNHLQGAQSSMRLMLQNENNKSLEQKQKLPNYKLEVPVVFDLPRFREMDVESRQFPLITNNINTDLKRWNEMRRDSEFKLKDVINRAEIALDESAERMRSLCSMDESEVSQLDKYQKRILDADLQKLYSLMQDLQKDLPDTQSTVNEEMRKNAVSVRESIMQRITGGQIKGVALIMVLLICLSVLPGLIIYTLDNVGQNTSIISCMILLLDLFVIPIVIMVFRQKKTIREKISGYNLAVNSAVRKVSENSGMYSDFLSSIVSHSRGKSYLHILKNKKFAMSDKYVAVDRHMRAIEKMIDILERWNKAFYLEVNFNQNYYEDNDFEIKVQPNKNKIYALEYGNEYKVPLNNSGQKVKTNFEFVKKMQLIREELYD